MSVRVFTDPLGAGFMVDGERYRSSAVFLWPEGSKHVLTAEASYTGHDGSAFGFKEWQDSHGVKFQDGSLITITASRDVTFYKAVWKLFYSVTLAMNTAPGLPFACLPGAEWGKIYVNIPGEDSCYTSSVVLWEEAGKTIKVQAHAPAGFVFLGWSLPVNGNHGSSLSFVLDRPILLSAVFEQAARVRLETEPPRLQLLADRTTVSTPIVMDWAAGSDHAVGAISPQRDENGAPWVFESWSDGGTEHHLYTAAAAVAVATLTARFSPGVSFGFTTVPAGLKISVDGRTNWPGYNFVWAKGSEHTVSAPPEQTDAQGRRYVFRAWTHGGDATQALVATVHGGWTAVYEQLGRLTIRTEPQSAVLEVDGGGCASPCTVHRHVGEEVRVSAPGSVSVSEDTRMEFDSWSDSAAAARAFTITQDAALTVRYRVVHRLRSAADPAAGAHLRLEPGSQDGFYPEGASVAVIVEPASGYSFRCWEGDLSGRQPSGILRMGGPRAVRAMLDKKPETIPVVVRNAAGETPEPGVAGGSLISILGPDLAPAELALPRGPFAQSLGGVAVRIGDHFLPLVMIAPEQINAQMPTTLPEGEYDLKVLAERRKEQTARVQVVRNAPGLFGNAEGLAAANHSDGSPVTPERPARPGETLTVFGTGFGPCDPALLDGFPAPLPCALVDPVEVFLEGRRLEPLSAGAVVGEVGIVAVRFRIPEDSSGRLDLRVKVNGKESNAVRLVVETLNP